VSRKNEQHKTQQNEKQPDRNDEEERHIAQIVFVPRLVGRCLLAKYPHNAQNPFLRPAGVNEQYRLFSTPTGSAQLHRLFSELPSLGKPRNPASGPFLGMQEMYLMDKQGL